jgi:3-dehydrosphinganine reductase
MEATVAIEESHLVVTGGSSGIGFAVARRAVQAGARVTLVARRPAELEKARDELREAFPKATVRSLPLDVSLAADVDARLSELDDEDPIDVLINNAGVVMPGRFVELPAEEFRQMMEINYFGIVNACRVVVPRMIARHRGHVLNVSSLAGVLGIYGYTAYSASKFAVVGFSQALRGELWPHGVGVSVCMPPDTDTPQLAWEDRYKPAETKAIAGTIKPLAADEVAKKMLDGIARRKFEIYCDVGSKMVSLAQGATPSLVRWFCDSAQKKAGDGEVRES